MYGRSCNENGYDKVVASLCLENFLKAIDPYVQQKARIVSLRKVSHLILKPNEVLEVCYDPLPMELEQALRMLDNLTAAEAKRWTIAAI